MKTWARKTFTDTRTGADGSVEALHHEHDVFLVPEASGDGSPARWEFAMAEDGAAAAQLLEAMLLTEAGEVPMDTRRGVDNIGTVLQNSALTPRWADSVRRVASSCPYVAEVKGMDYTLDSGSIHYTIRTKTTFGTEEEISNG